MRTLIDEYGDTGILQPEENRRDGSGRRLGPKPAWLAKMAYDLKQRLSPVERRLDERPATVDISGQPMDGP